MRKLKKRRLKIFLGFLPIAATAAAIVVISTKENTGKKKPQSKLLNKSFNDASYALKANTPPVSSAQINTPVMPKTILLNGSTNRIEQSQIVLGSQGRIVTINANLDQRKMDKLYVPVNKAFAAFLNKNNGYKKQIYIPYDLLVNGKRVSNLTFRITSDFIKNSFIKKDSNNDYFNEMEMADGHHHTYYLELDLKTQLAKGSSKDNVKRYFPIPDGLLGDIRDGNSEKDIEKFRDLWSKTLTKGEYTTLMTFYKKLKQNTINKLSRSEYHIPEDILPDNKLLISDSDVSFTTSKIDNSIVDMKVKYTVSDDAKDKPNKIYLRVSKRINDGLVKWLEFKSKPRGTKFPIEVEYLRSSVAKVLKFEIPIEFFWTGFFNKVRKEYRPYYLQLDLNSSDLASNHTVNRYAPISNGVFAHDWDQIKREIDGFDNNSDVVTKDVEKFRQMWLNTLTDDEYINLVVFYKRLKKRTVDLWKARTSHKVKGLNKFGNLTKKEIDKANKICGNINDYTSYVAFNDIYAEYEKRDEDIQNALEDAKIIAQDLGFTPTNGSAKPADLSRKASAAEYKVYNVQMTKFNDYQKQQLTIAQTISNTKNTDDKANEYNHLTPADLTSLGTKRKAIKNSKSNDAFLALFNKLIVKDLLGSVNEIKHKDINKFGYLQGDDFKQLDANIKALQTMLNKHSNNTYIKEFNKTTIDKSIKTIKSTYENDFNDLMNNKFGMQTEKDTNGVWWAKPYKPGSTPGSSKGYGVNFSINNNAESLFLGQDPKDGKWKNGSIETKNNKITISKTSNFIDWNIKMTGAFQDSLIKKNKGKKAVAFAQVNDLLKKLGIANNDPSIKEIKITFENNSNVVKGKYNTRFRINILGIKIIYKDLNDIDLNDINKIIEGLKREDKQWQAAAINAIKLVDRGYKPTIIKVTEPRIGISLKKQIDAYANYVVAFNAEQNSSYDNDIKQAHTKYKDDNANVNKCLEQSTLKKLDDARKAIKDKTTFDDFVKLFEAYKSIDDSKYKATKRRLVKKVDLGFKSTIGSRIPNSLSKTATTKEYNDYNDQMKKFNKDQDRQRVEAILFSQTTYTDFNANEYDHVAKRLNELDDARAAIKDNKTNEAFLGKYLELRGIDLNKRAAEVTNEQINALGYLVDKPIGNDVFTRLDVLRKAVHSDATFKLFNEEKDKLSLKGREKQKKVIENLTHRSTLGFKSTIKPVVSKPKLGTSTKKQIEAYAVYVGKFNAEQKKISNNAYDEVNGEKYANEVANKYKTLSDVITYVLDSARETFNQDRSKANYEAFIKLFNSDKKLDKNNHDASEGTKVKAHDLGFTSTSGSEKPTLKTNPTTDDYKKYNAQMTKFNDDQMQKLTVAQTLAKDKYTNVYANENKNLSNVDLTKLDDARGNIKNNATYNTFLNLFWVLKAKDFNNTLINEFGYLTANITAINTARNAVKDQTTYDTFIAKKDAWIQKDKDAQAEAIKNLTPLSTLGFKSTIKPVVSKPKLGISTKAQIEDYAAYVKTFNDEQNASSTNASNEVNGAKYTNAVANKYGTLTTPPEILKTLTAVRETFNKLKNKTNYDAFIKLFDFDKKLDESNHKAEDNEQVKPEDKGFDSSTNDFKQPAPLNKATATTVDYKKFNAQMTKFNNDQARQLEHAQTLAKDKYTNVYANENKNLSNAYLTKLDYARGNIKNNATYNTFLNLFWVLKAKDFNNAVINEFGYLTADITAINTARNAVKDQTTYDTFIAKKDAWIQKDKDAQAEAIKNLTPLSTLGFKSTIKPVVSKPKLGISTKAQIEDYAAYVKTFNDEQNASSTNASNEVNGAKYTNAVANKYGTLTTPPEILKTLTAVRETFNKLKNKTNYDAFIKLFDFDKKLDESNHKAEDNEQVKPEDKGFDSSTNDFKQPAPLNKATATTVDYKKFNAQMTKFNNDQARQLEHAQTLAKDKYTNVYANENKNLSNVDLTKLDDARGSIKNNATYNTFLNLFWVLKAKDFNNTLINEFGYLTANITAINTARNAVKDQTTYDTFIAKKDAWIQKDKDAQAEAIKNLTPLSTLGFKSTIKPVVSKPKLGISTKAQIEDYAAYAKTFNDEQNASSTNASNEVNGAKYTNAVANKYGTIKDDMAALDTARETFNKLKNKTNYDAFITLFKADQDRDLVNHKADIKSQVKEIDLGFKPTKGSEKPVPYVLDKQTATKDDYKKFNAQMTKFNNDQARQLEHAQTLAKDKYTNVYANENKNLSNVDLTKLDDARGNIKNNATYNTFLNLFWVLKAKDFNNTLINEFGYLTANITAINTARNAVKDQTTYDTFITKKDAWIQKDKKAQAEAIKNLTPLSTLGFDSAIKLVATPKVGISIKTNIDAYADYVKAFNTEQNTSSTNASNEVNGAKYTNAVANKYGTIKDDMAALDTARETFNKLKNKTNYDAFITLFKADQDRDLVNHKADIKSQVKEIDLGFKPTKGSEKPVPYVLDKQTATKADYKKFNAQMTKFNNDQARQLEHAQTLAKDKYANVYANENKNLSNVDLTKLDDARGNIKNNATYNTFLNLFRVLKAKDFSNAVINKFGYLTADITAINTARNAVKDQTTYDAFIAKKDAWIQKDKKAQAEAIKNLTPLSTLGFDSVIKLVATPKVGISIKTNIDAYADYVKAFNTEQNTSSTNASNEVNGAKYTNAVANKYGTIKDDMAALDTARETFNKLKNKTNYDAFITLFKADQARDLVNHKADIKSQVKEIDLGFKPTKGSEKPVPYVLDKQTATKADYKKFNAQMTKFNNDQARQLEHAQTLAKDKYANVYANENKNLEEADLAKLDDARDAIATKTTYNTFLNLFRVLKAKDFSNAVINKFGYLTTDITEINTARNAVKDQTTYDAFIAKKDAWIQKDKKAQAEAIKNLTPLSTLGFDSVIKLVATPKVGISIKTNIDAYADYVKAFNTEQNTSSTNASNEVNGAKYTNAVANKYGTIKDDMAALDTARETFNKLKNKTNYDAFITLFKADQARDLVNHKADIKSQVKEIDLGFKPTKGSEKPVPYVLDKQTATKADYKKFNAQMTKFNNDQARQLEHAQTLAKDKYANVYANENKNLEEADLAKLDDARDAIATKTTYNTFLNLFRVLKAKDFSNAVINKFGYLTTDITEINTARNAVKDQTTYDAFIAKKDAWIQKDKKAQAEAIKNLTPLSTLGFDSVIKLVATPKVGISIKANIDAYADYVKAFNTEQNTSSTNASNEVNGAKYTNAVANKYGTIKDDMAALDTARETFNKLKNKTNYDAFITLFKADQARDLINHNADIKSQVKEIDLGFNPTKGSEKPVPYVLDKQTATKADYKKFNAQMTKFNNGQARQLEHAQTLAKDKYANVYANENKNLEEADLAKLDDARDAIATKTTYNTFLNLFRVLKAKDFSNAVINKFGYLTADITAINTARNAVKDQTTYDAFIAKKDAWIQKDKKAQAEAIKNLTPLSTLGFDSAIKLVATPKVGISIKTNIDAYAAYVKTFNDEQNASSTNASNEVNGAKYTNAVANKYGTIKDDMAALDTARETFNKLKNKTNYDAFITLFKADQARDLVNHKADIKSQVKEIDLGFKPTKGSEKPVPYVLDKQTATKADYKKFNAQMTKFNNGQARQLEHAQTLAKDKYANVYANENKNLEEADLAKLDDARGNIKNNATYNTFLNLFRVLKAKDFSNAVINKFGYLTTDITEINTARNAVKDQTTYDAFIAKKDAWIQKDKKAQAEAIKNLTPLSTLGFDSVIKLVATPKVGISIKTNIDAYADYVKTFNDEQNASSTNASNEVNGAKYTNAVANKYGTIKDDMAALDTARETFNKLKNKTNYDAFITLFKADQNRDLVNHKADIKSQVKEIDLGFKPTKGSEKPVPYVLDEKTATKADYKKFNAQMTKFNNDQARQLEHAQTLAKDKYTNVYANENKNLEEADLAKLDDARDAIATKTTYNTFLNLFRVLKAKDFSNAVINKFGYLTADITAINTARNAVKDQTTYDAFIAKKDAWIQKDKKAQAEAIKNLTPLSTLGFDSAIKLVATPKVGISIKTNIDAYADYVKAFNTEQNTSSTNASNEVNGAKYTNAVANKYGTIKDDMAALDTARETFNKLKNKTNYDAFITLFKADQTRDLVNHKADIKSQVKEIDLGFKPTKGSEKPVPYVLDKQTATKDDYKKFNAQMTKFNGDQAKQLEYAQTLAKTTYADENANEYGHVEGKLGTLGILRGNIINNSSNNIFVENFNKLRGEDLKAEAIVNYSNEKINALGYLIIDVNDGNYDFVNLDKLRNEIIDGATFEKFIKEKDGLVRNDIFREEKAMDFLKSTPLSALGFKSTMDPVVIPTKDISTKTQIDDYVAYVKSFNTEQGKLLVEAQETAGTALANAKVDGYLKEEDLADLGNPEEKIADKASYDKFMGDLQALRLKNFKLVAKEDFSNEKINTLGYLIIDANDKNYDFKKLDTLRSQVTNETTFKKFIKAKDELVVEDITRQRKTMEGLMSLNKLGFTIEIERVNTLKLGISTKAEIELYVNYVTSFNNKQQAALDKAKEEAKTEYSNANANINNTLSKTILANLDTARKDIINKDTFEKFKALFKIDKDSDVENFKKIKDRIVAIEDKGFDSPDGFGKPKVLKADAKVEDYDAYNAQMAKFNQNQNIQLSTAITLSTNKYTNESANQYNHIGEKLNSLDTLRDKIINKSTNDAFVERFKRLRGEDLRTEAKLSFSNEKINALGYLETKDYELKTVVTNRMHADKNQGNERITEFERLRNNITDETSFNKFIKAKNKLVALDVKRQRIAIENLAKLNDLGFSSREPKVAYPIIAISKKEEIIKYDKYITAFNREQAELLKNAKKLAQGKYALDKLNENKHQSSTEVKKNLINVRKKIVNKNTYDIFVATFQKERLVNLKAAVLDFTRKVINKFGYLEEKDFKTAKIDRLKNVVDEVTYKAFIRKKDMLVNLDAKRQKDAIEALKRSHKELGFKSTITTSVKSVALGLSTKQEIEAYAKYVKAFSAEQTRILKKVKNDAKTKYTNEHVNENNNISAKQLDNLDNLREMIKDKDSNDEFINKFNELKLLDNRTEVSTNYTDDKINKFKKLSEAEMSLLKNMRKNIGTKNGFKLFKDVAKMLKVIDKERSLGTTGKGAILEPLDGEGAPDPASLGENPTLDQILEFNYKVAEYNGGQRLLEQQGILKLKGRVAKLKLERRPVMPFTEAELTELQTKENKIKILSTLAEVTRAVGEFESEYNLLLDKKSKQLKERVEKVKKENEITNFGFTDSDAPKLPTLSPEKELTKKKLGDYQTAVIAFNLYQKQQRKLAQDRLKSFILNEEHVGKKRVARLRKAIKEVQGAANSEKFAKLYKNFVSQYLDSVVVTPPSSKTSNLLKIVILSVGGLLIIILIGVIVKLKRKKKKVSNFSGKSSGSSAGIGDDEIEEWGDEDFEGWN